MHLIYHECNLDFYNFPHIFLNFAIYVISSLVIVILMTWPLDDILIEFGICKELVTLKIMLKALHIHKNIKICKQYK